MIRPAIAIALFASVTLRTVGAEAQSPLVELDHVYVVVPDHRAAIDRLTDAGLTIDTSIMARHTGSGTASVAAMFANAYLEILWADSSVSVTEASRADLDAVRRKGGWDPTGPSPFGVGLRRTAGAPDSLPYAGTRASPEWMEPGTSFFSFERSNEGEPSVFVVPAYMAFSAGVSQLRAARPEILEHDLGMTRLTGVVIYATDSPASVLEAGLDNVEFRRGAMPRLELIFDHGPGETTLDLRPDLPLVLRY